MVIKKHSIILLLGLFLVFALALTACGSEAKIDQGPVIKLVVGDTTYEVEPYVYCWPQSADDIHCDLDEGARVQPAEIVTVNANDEVRFVIDGVSQSPSSFTARLLDGPQDVQILNMEEEGIFDAAYEDGQYRVQVDVEYEDINGQPGNVSFVYGLSISGKVVIVVPTATPTMLPTSTPTVAPTATNTPEPTSTSIPEPTATKMPLPTASPTAITALPTATPIVVETTATPTETTPETADTGPEPTATEPPQVVTNPSAEDVPPLVLVVGRRQFEPVGYRYCKQVAAAEQVCVERPSDAASPTRFELARGMSGQLHIAGARPNEVRIEYLSDTGLPTGQPETQIGDNLILFVVSPEPGSYIMSVRVTWPEQVATYFFRVAVHD